MITIQLNQHKCVQVELQLSISGWLNYIFETFEKRAKKLTQQQQKITLYHYYNHNFRVNIEYLLLRGMHGNKNLQNSWFLNALLVLNA